MSKSRFIAAAVAGAFLAILLLHPAEGATEKSGSKKSTPATKKKTSGSTTKKKTEEPPKTEGESTSALDLPLPAEVTRASESGTPAKKKATDGAANPAEPTDKPPADAETKGERAPSATVEPEAIAEFAALPPRLQQIFRDAIDLTRRNLAYTFGSADPDKGGMDCSGTIYYLLRAHGINDVARDSSGQYLWARKRGTFFPVVSKNGESVEFEELQPGDLMFWTGTYSTGRDVPISHVMLYLGREKATGKRIMFGASDGRSYDGVQRWGVSVFDFKMPKPEAAGSEKAKVDFVGFARIPGLRAEAPVVAESEVVEPKEPPKKTAKPSPSPTPRSKTSTKKKKSQN